MISTPQKGSKTMTYKRKLSSHSIDGSQSIEGSPNGGSPNGDGSVIILDPSFEVGPQSRTKRIRACQRCYKQKLKCDLYRPCTLCVRSSVGCIDRPARSTRKRRNSTIKQYASNVTICEPNSPSHAIPPEDVPVNNSGHQTPNIFDQCSSQTLLSLIQRSKSKASPHSESSWSAISPDAQFDSGGGQLLPWGHNRPRIRDLLSVLPARSITRYGLVVYFNTVHWFMMVVHEGQTMRNFRTYMNAIENEAYDGLDDTEDFSELLCIMVMLAIGTKYALAHPARRRKILSLFMKENGAQNETRALDLAESSMNTLLSVIRVSILDSLSSCTLATVQTCMLFGTFYLYHGDPNIALSVLGCGYKAVQTISLNRESYWARTCGITNPEASEICHLRRRVFWSLFITDRFFAMFYGLPLDIPDEGCDVGIPDHMAAYPESGTSSFLLNDIDIGAGMDVSLMTYQTYKLQFYILMGEVKAKLYGQKERNFLHLVDCYEGPQPKKKSSRSHQHQKENTSKVQDLIVTIKYFDQKLRNWYDALPDVLKMDYHQDWAKFPREVSDLDEDLIDPEFDDQQSHSEAVRQKQIRTKRAIFARQALILQIGYDNIMILIHRKLLMYTHLDQMARKGTEMMEDPMEYSRNVCWEATIRSCDLTKSRIYSECQETHAGSFIGFHLFTSGVMCYYFGSYEPLGPRSTQAKQGLRAIIQSQRQFASKFPVAKYSLSILETLIKRMMQKEMDMILAPSNLSPRQSIDEEMNNQNNSAREQETAMLISGWKENGSDVSPSAIDFASNGAQGPGQSAELQMWQEMQFVPNEFFSETISEVDRGKLKGIISKVSFL